MALAVVAPALSQSGSLNFTPGVATLALNGRAPSMAQSGTLVLTPGVATLGLATPAPALSAAIGILTATVHSSGAKIDITFISGSVSLTASQLSVMVGGNPLWVSSVTGSGTSWTAFPSRRWVRAGKTVTVAYNGGSPVTATNSSATTEQQVKYVGRGFGMFIHFGLETWLDVEWATPGQSLSVWNPTLPIADCIDQWIAAAKLAGMKYLVLTAKHHIGFCLWPSSTTSYNISNTSWYSGAGSPDIVRLFVNKVRAAGLGVGLYFSVWDRNLELSSPSNATYKAFVQAQMAELLGNYGPIDLLWIDGYAWLGVTLYGVPYTTIAQADIYGYAKGLQPNCQIVINNHEHSIVNTDIMVYEAPYEGVTPSGNLVPSETADTIRVDAAWFWKTAADAGVAAATINSALSTANGRYAPYLLNCPPDRSGKLPAGTIARLAEIGSGVLEQVNGNAASTTRTITLTLTSDGTTPRASLTGLKCEFWNEPSPALHNTPSCIVLGASTNGSGVMTISVETTLGSGGTGYLLVTDTDGTTTQSPAPKAFAGPVTVT